MTEETKDQSLSQNNQNFTVDLDQIFKDWITPIDALRSYSRPDLNQEFSKLGNTNDKTDITAYVKNLGVETTPQESRCHAFYRMIGFPVVSEDNLMYNPGFDIFVCKGKKVPKSKKLAIARNPISSPKKFNTLSFEREKFVFDNLSIFSNPLSIKAGLLALSSGGTEALRKFNAPFDKKSDPFDVDVESQTYPVNLNGRVGEGKNAKVSLKEYRDAGGNYGPPSDKRKHIIKPFIVDARIDFTVMPQSKLVAVPFVPDDSFLKVSATESVNRPLIEKVIRDRILASDPANSAGTAVNKVDDYVRKNSSISDNELINRVKGINNVNTQEQFIDSLNVIITMVEALIKSEEFIRTYQSYYYWVPVPSETGPEGGVKVQGVFLPSYLQPQQDNKLATDKDKSILVAYAKSITNNINIDATAINGAPDPKSYSISKTDFSSKTASGMGDNNAQDLETINEVRARVLNDAGTHLRNVEIIMGEFSGFGLCDIVAIMGALKIMPLGNLYGLLDEDAYNRMKVALPTAKETQESFLSSMDVFSKLVADYYNLMDSIYKSTKNKSSKSK